MHSDTRARTAAAVVGGALAIAVGAQVSVPMVPVPTTLQTLALVAVALVAGPWRGLGAAALYLALATVGLPVLADGASHPGAQLLALKSVGYVVGFLPAAWVAGKLASGAKGRALPLLGAGLLAHAIVLAVGVPVLALHIGAGPAIAHGLLPFLPGAVAKSVVAALAAHAVRRGATSSLGLNT